MAGIITSVKDFEEFACASLAENVCLTAVATRVSGGNIPTKTVGQIVVRDGNFFIQFRSSPKVPRKLSFHSQATPIEPVKWARLLIDGHLAVRAENIFLQNESYILGGTSYCDFKIGKIVEQPRRMQRNSVRNIEMRALLPATKLQSKNTVRQINEKWSDESPSSQTAKREALSGTIGRYNYSFRQVAEDLLVVIQLRKGVDSTSAAGDLKFFRALLMAFNWMNGGTPFERHLAHRREYGVHHVLSNKWKGPIPKSRLISSDPDGTIGINILSIATPFFLRSLPFNEGVKMLMWQYREAVRSGSITLGGLLQICSLLEGLIGLILRHRMKLSKKKIDSLPIPQGGAGRPGSAEARFYHASSHLGFSWTAEFEQVFTQWKDVRNKLAHGEIVRFQEVSGHQIIGVFHQILQAFNSL